MKNMLRIESFKISYKYRDMAWVEGTCRVIVPSAYMITMEKPYKGLIKAEYFYQNKQFDIESIKSRATFELGRLYEQYQDILYDYDRYRKIWEEWKRYEQKIQTLKTETLTLRKEANGADMPLLDFYEKMLDKDATQYFYDLLDKYDIKPLSLSPSVLETSIRLIDEGFNHR